MEWTDKDAQNFKKNFQKLSAAMGWFSQEEKERRAEAMKVYKSSAIGKDPLGLKEPVVLYENQLDFWEIFKSIKQVNATLVAQLRAATKIIKEHPDVVARDWKFLVGNQNLTNQVIRAKVVVLIDCDLTCEAIESESLIALGKSYIDASAIWATQYTGLWCRKIKADYARFCNGEISVDELDIESSKNRNVQVFTSGQSYDWRLVAHEAKHFVNAAKESGVHELKDLKLFEVGAYGTNSHMSKLLLDDEIPGSDMCQEFQREIDLIRQLLKNDQKAAKTIDKILSRNVKNSDLLKILRGIFMNGTADISDLIDFVMTSDSSDVFSELENFGNQTRSFVSRAMTQAQSTPSRQSAALDVDNNAADSQVDLTKEDWETIDGLTNKQLGELLYGYVPEDVAGTDKQKSKAVLLSEIKMLAHVDKRFHEYAGKYLEILRNTSWEEAKKDPSLIHSETVAEAQAEAKAEEQSETTNNAAEPDSTQQADTQVTA